MIHVEIKDLYNRKNILLWSLLSMKAGIINTAGFLIAGSYVSHVTGFGTQVGIALGHKQYNFGTELLIIPVAFIGGAFLTSVLLDRNYNKDETPNYPRVQFLITFLLGFISLLFLFNVFTINELKLNSGKSTLLIGLLCLVCGLKNALTTWATHGKIRTTHLTGLSTDIGLHLSKLFSGEKIKSRFPENEIVVKVRILTWVSFSVGAFVSALLIPVIGYKIFYLLFSISFVFFLISVDQRKKIQELSEPKENYIGEYHANVN